MAQGKKIVVSLPEDLLALLDGFARRQGKGNRSACVRQAIRSFLRERRRTEVCLERLRRGYERMGGLNRRLAEEGFDVDRRALEAYESTLAGRDRD